MFVDMIRMLMILIIPMAYIVLWSYINLKAALILLASVQFILTTVLLISSDFYERFMCALREINRTMSGVIYFERKRVVALSYGILIFLLIYIFKLQDPALMTQGLPIMIKPFFIILLLFFLLNKYVDPIITDLKTGMLFYAGIGMVIGLVMFYYIIVMVAEV